MTLRKKIQILVVTLALCTPAARAQDQNSTSDSTGPASPLSPQNSATVRSRNLPAPAGRGLLSYSPEAQAPESQPDTHFLSGAESIGLGSLQALRSLFDPALRITQSADAGVVAGHTNSVTSLGGSLLFERHGKQSHLTALYNGAHTFYRPDSLFDRPYHGLAVSEELQRGRWTLRLRDDMALSPESAFGNLPTGGAASGPDSSLTGIKPSLAPSDTIATGRTKRLNNTALGELSYGLTRRTAMTLVGSYGVLHFLDSGFIGSRQTSGRIGLDHALNAKNSLALNYGFDDLRFSGSTSRMQSHLMQMALGRRITGRLALQLAAGPQILHPRNYGAFNANSWGWSMFSALSYQQRFSSYALSYFRGITGGSGVLLGSRTDTISASATHQFARSWSASVNGGYARNNNLTSNGTTASRFENWFGGVTLDRALGQHARMGMNYTFQDQNHIEICPVASCGVQSPRQLFTVSLEWHLRPARLESARRP